MYKTSPFPRRPATQTGIKNTGNTTVSKVEDNDDEVKLTLLLPFAICALLQPIDMPSNQTLYVK